MTLQYISGYIRTTSKTTAVALNLLLQLYPIHPKKCAAQWSKSSEFMRY